MTALLKYWPLVNLPLSFFVAWICWSLRELAKAEVRTIVAQAITPVDERATKLTARVDDHHDKLTTHGSQIEEIRTDIRDLPTKTDLAHLQGEIRGVGSEVQAANAGIKRIEGYFLERGVRSQS